MLPLVRGFFVALQLVANGTKRHFAAPQQRSLLGVKRTSKYGQVRGRRECWPRRHRLISCATSKGGVVTLRGYMAQVSFGIFVLIVLIAIVGSTSLIEAKPAPLFQAQVTCL